MLVSLCDEIYNVLIENKVIYFRNKNLSNEQHIKFAKSFGEIEPPHLVYPLVDNYPEIVLLGLILVSFLPLKILPKISPPTSDSIATDTEYNKYIFKLG